MSENSEPRSKAKETGISLTGASRYREANFECWGKMAFWLPDEIAALSLGKDPSSLNEFSVGEVALSNIGLEFLEISETARRAVLVEQIPEKCQPDVAIQWMKKFDLKIPEALEYKVAQFYPSFDWKAILFHFHSKTLEALDSILNELKLDRDPKIFVCSQELEGLCNRIVQNIRDEAISKTHASDADSVDLVDGVRPVNDNASPEDNTKVYQSRDKLLAGMFCSNYSYDPEANKQTAFTDLIGDLDRCGIVLNYETAKKHLLDAIGRVGPELPYKD